MKILLIIHHHLDPNQGAPGVTLQVGQQYQDLGHEVLYYSYDNLPPSLTDKAKSVIFPWLVANYITKLSRRQAVDVVDASTGDAWVWAKALRNFRENSPLLVTRSHGLEHTWYLEELEESRRGNLQLSWKFPLYHGGFRLWEVAASLGYADLVFLLNHFDLEYAIHNLGVSPKKAHVFPNGLLDTFLDLPFESTPELDNTTIRIAQIGSYIPRKGIHYGAPALNKILTCYSNVQVSFLGTGCAEADVYADFEPNVCDRIRVVPHYSRETLFTLLKGHQIKLFPTVSDGFGLVLIEAMACGLTPVTTTTPGPTEIVTDGYNGLLVPSRDSPSIERTLEQLICDRPYLEKLRRNAHATAQLYSWKRIAQNMLSLYEEALDKRKSTSKYK
jgi:glycosyltransferase involved in cell wall biosynthesis